MHIYCTFAQVISLCIFKLQDLTLNNSKNIFFLPSSLLHGKGPGAQTNFEGDVLLKTASEMDGRGKWMTECELQSDLREEGKETVEIHNCPLRKDILT